MEAHEKNLLARLVSENSELAEMVARHQSLESRLEEMNHRRYLSPEDDLERKRIQKSKLAVKDKIQAFLDQHQG